MRSQHTSHRSPPKAGADEARVLYGDRTVLTIPITMCLSMACAWKWEFQNRREADGLCLPDALE